MSKLKTGFIIEQEDDEISIKNNSHQYSSKNVLVYVACTNPFIPVLLNKSKQKWEDNQLHHRHHLHMQKECHMQKFQSSLCHFLHNLQNMVCGTNKRNHTEVLPRALYKHKQSPQVHGENPHTNCKVTLQDYTLPQAITKAPITSQPKSLISSLFPKQREH